MTPEILENNVTEVLEEEASIDETSASEEAAADTSEIQENNVLFLIGAGCSAEAGIKVANSMVTDIENFVKNDESWNKYEHLYYYLKSSILYSDGIQGNFTTSLNVEKLVVVINELAKKELNIAYPFIGNWNTRLIEVAGENFENIREFGKKISKQLFEWINIGDYSAAEYHRGFANFKTEIEV